MANAYVSFFSDEGNRKTVADILDEIEFEQVQVSAGNLRFENMTFVITGSLNHFSNREELVAVIEENGGKVSGSVSSKTSYLVNNDITSGSSKNKKAKELGVSIITEDQLLEMLR